MRLKHIGYNVNVACSLRWSVIVSGGCAEACAGAWRCVSLGGYRSRGRPAMVFRISQYIY